jgi:hypothetical protein
MCQVFKKINMGEKKVKIYFIIAFLAILLAALFAAMAKMEAARIRRYGLEVRWRDILCGGYFPVCGCGHPTYQEDWVMIHDSLRIWMKIESLESQRKTPPLCHRCLGALLSKTPMLVSSATPPPPAKKILPDQQKIH